MYQTPLAPAQRSRHANNRHQSVRLYAKRGIPLAVTHHCKAQKYLRSEKLLNGVVNQEWLTVACGSLNIPTRSRLLIGNIKNHSHRHQLWSPAGEGLTHTIMKYLCKQNDKSAEIEHTEVRGWFNAPTLSQHVIGYIRNRSSGPHELRRAAVSDWRAKWILIICNPRDPRGLILGMRVEYYQHVTPYIKMYYYIYIYIYIYIY